MNAHIAAELEPPTLTAPGSTTRREYAGMVTHLDSATKSIVDAMQAYGLWQDTLLFVGELICVGFPLSLASGTARPATNLAGFLPLRLYKTSVIPNTKRVQILNELLSLPLQQVTMAATTVLVPATFRSEVESSGRSKAAPGYQRSSTL